jgi:hypothetical protein
MIIMKERAKPRLWPPLELIGRGVRACDSAMTALGVTSGCILISAGVNIIERDAL